MESGVAGPSCPPVGKKNNGGILKVGENGMRWEEGGRGTGKTLCLVLGKGVTMWAKSVLWGKIKKKEGVWGVKSTKGLSRPGKLVREAKGGVTGKPVYGTSCWKKKKEFAKKTGRGDHWYYLIRGEVNQRGKKGEGDCGEY